MRLRQPSTLDYIEMRWTHHALGEDCFHECPGWRVEELTIERIGAAGLVRVRLGEDVACVCHWDADEPDRGQVDGVVGVKDPAHPRQVQIQARREQ